MHDDECHKLRISVIVLPSYQLPLLPTMRLTVQRDLHKRVERRLVLVGCDGFSMRRELHRLFQWLPVGVSHSVLPLERLESRRRGIVHSRLCARCVFLRLCGRRLPVALHMVWRLVRHGLHRFYDGGALPCRVHVDRISVRIPAIVVFVAHDGVRMPRGGKLSMDWVGLHGSVLPGSELR